MKRYLVFSGLTIVTMSLLSGAAYAEPDQADGGSWSFTERSEATNLDYRHDYDGETEFRAEIFHIAGGLAIGDLNGDGWDDIYAVTGYSNDEGENLNPNRLFISKKDGTYTEAASDWGLSDSDRHSSGPLIADFNGDGLNDLLVGGVNTDSIKLYLNTGSSGFSDATVSSGLDGLLDPSWNVGMAAGDIDRDGDLDLFVSHWRDLASDPIRFLNSPLLFENDGSGVFTDISNKLSGNKPRHVFTPTFADIDGDGWLDLMLASDFLNESSNGGGSRYFLNDGAGSFIQQGHPVAKEPGPDADPYLGPDENGMGSAVIDYDNDGDLDWFVTSIYDTDQVSEANWGISGNRLYNNDGGVFTDVTETAGVRNGFWGWGACFVDFNNDMHLDLFHVNGFFANRYNEEDEFDSDPARMFINNGSNVFAEMADALGVSDRGYGRAVLCFDSDHDGDLDILINNNHGDAHFYRNELENGNHWIVVRLQQDAPNREAIGAKISLVAGGITQTHQVVAGGNFESSHPTAQHFGLAGNDTITSITVTWPDGEQQTWGSTPVDDYITLIKATDLLKKDGFE